MKLSNYVVRPSLVAAVGHVHPAKGPQGTVCFTFTVVAGGYALEPPYATQQEAEAARAALLQLMT